MVVVAKVTVWDAVISGMVVVVKVIVVDVLLDVGFIQVDVIIFVLKFASSVSCCWIDVSSDVAVDLSMDALTDVMFDVLPAEVLAGGGNANAFVGVTITSELPMSTPLEEFSRGAAFDCWPLALLNCDRVLQTWMPLYHV